MSNKNTKKKKSKNPQILFERRINILIDYTFAKSSEYAIMLRIMIRRKENTLPNYYRGKS